MISVVNEREIDRGSAPVADPPVFGVGNPQEGPVALVGRGSDGSRVPMELKNKVNGAAWEPSDPKDAPRDVEVVMGEGRFSEFNAGEGVAAAADAAAELPAPDPEEGRVFEEDKLAEEVAVSDGARVPRGAVGNWMNGFEVGDMVWGKVKSHPWWPGYIFDDAFASHSVRRMKREGHVLVAFFGDSSYGWFEPAELIPFAPHYAEKSKQTTLRPFVMAVEEAVDETSRREALALTCYCRNPFNFRSARVPGYFRVDVPGFEPGAIYSSKQINSARDKFVPDKVLSFVQQAALDPLTTDLTEVDQIKRMAMLLAYRKAVFEEFDETYAQAFGVQPVRPSPVTGAMLDQPERFATRVPLSGQFVIPEPLGYKKSFWRKGVKVPAAKKNKYLLKRRDGQESWLSGSIRAPKTSLSNLPSLTQFNRDYLQQPITSQIQPAIVSQSASHATASGSKLGDYALQKKTPTGTDGKPTETFGDSHSRGNAREKLKLEAPARKVACVNVDSEDGLGLEQPTPTDARMIGVAQKEKIKKRPREDGSSVKPDGTGDVKKKKKEASSEIGPPDHDHVHTLSKPAGKTIVTGRELVKGEDVSRTIGPSALAVQPPKIDFSTRNLELPELVGGLHELALDPFYGIDRGAPSIALHVFLKFRSLVYQKSLALPAASEAETLEVQAGMSSAARTPREPVAGSSEVAASAKAPSTSKQQRVSLRQDDPTVVGRKRSPSDRQEETSAKRQKKLDKLKALGAEKKAATSSSTTAAAAVEPQSDPPPPPPSPTTLVMKFPPRTTLPSVASLKARFARFGTLELSGTRVLWKSNTCKVVYKYKTDAEAALHSASSNAIFGGIKVHYQLRDALEPSSDVGGQRPEPRLAEALQPRPASGASSSSSSVSFAQPWPLLNHNPKPAGQLKSILKKPSNEAGPGPSGGAGREAPRVKFLLDGAEPPVVASSNNNGSSNADPPSSSLPPMEPVLSKTPNSVSFLPPPAFSCPSQLIDNRHHLPPPPVMPPPLPPRVAGGPLPPPPPPPPRQILNGAARSSDPRPLDCRQQGEAEGRDKVNIDFANQMLSLLLRCSDIVSSVKSSLGINVPYHPL